MRCVFVRSCVLASSLLIAAAARAQPPDSAGVRAQGMAGAFTAVADDATATWWNPAGLATGAYFNAIIEYGRLTDSDGTRGGVSVAFPALGLSYYRMTVSEMQPAGSTAGSAGGRQDPAALNVRSVDLSQFGATVGQSVGRYVVVASTLKLLRAAGDTQAGLDLGSMAALGPLRLGVMLRNVTEPTFGAGDAAVTLRRQVRGGAALSVRGRSSLFAGATLAVDADFRSVPSALGDERRVAVGAEVWLWKRAIGARAGISGSTVGDSRTATSGGISAMVRQGLFVEGQLTGGSDVTRRGWTTALRVTF
jgi:hypothetical protein